MRSENSSAKLKTLTPFLSSPNSTPSLPLSLNSLFLSLSLPPGAHAVCPYLAFETARQWRVSPRTVALVKAGKAPDVTVAKAQANYKKAVEKGLLKILSKMGISLLSCYHGAQIFEAYGLGEPTSSRPRSRGPCLARRRHDARRPERERRRRSGPRGSRRRTAPRRRPSWRTTGSSSRGRRESTTSTTRRWPSCCTRRSVRSFFPLLSLFVGSFFFLDVFNEREKTNYLFLFLSPSLSLELSTYST